MAYIVRRILESKFNTALEQVKKLGKENSATLGFFPDGAFDEYFRKNQILIAEYSEKELAGYLLYRITTTKVVITHLCISDEHRRKGISSLLIDELVRLTKDNYLGIGLHCRRDFEASKLWPKYGFIPVSEKKGRSVDPTILTYWWLDHRHKDLLTESLNQYVSSRVMMAIDANVFYDVDENNNEPEGQESKSLLSDWFVGEVDIFLTDEIFAEIDRNSESEIRNYHKGRTFRFEQLQTIKSEVDLYADEICLILGKPNSVQDISDRKQLAHAISSNVDYFITRDKNILRHADGLNDKYDLLVRRPAEIILDIDRIRDEVGYRPKRLAGTLSNHNRARSEDYPSIVKAFTSQNGETNSGFAHHLLSLLSNPVKHKVSVSSNSNGDILSVLSYSEVEASVFKIDLFKVKAGRLARTLARYLILSLINELAATSFRWIVAENKGLSDEFANALHSEGFILEDQLWIRMITKQVATSDELFKKLNNLQRLKNDGSQSTSDFSSLVDKAKSYFQEANNQVERIIWPGKIVDLDIPCYIVPIRPGWARELFDAELSSQDLFGAQEKIALQNQGVYYYSHRGTKLRFPARLLWYVSMDSKFSGAGAIRGCSSLMESYQDTAKAMSNKFGRLGVYEWRDIYETAGSNPYGKLSALYFDRTELFKTPIRWERVQEIISDVDVNKSIVSAIEIPATIYFEIYKEGFN